MKVGVFPVQGGEHAALAIFLFVKGATAILDIVAGDLIVVDIVGHILALAVRDSVFMPELLYGVNV